MGLLFVLFLGVVYGALAATGNDRVDMNGRIVGVCDDQGAISPDSILVEGTTTQDSASQNISVRITKKTVILHKNGNTLVNASSSDLVSGKLVGIKFGGPILQTYPPMVNASEIILY